MTYEPRRYAYELIHISVNMGHNCNGNSEKIRRHRSKIGRPKFVHPRRGVHVAQQTSRLASKYFSPIWKHFRGWPPNVRHVPQPPSPPLRSTRAQSARHQLHFCQAVRSEFHYKKRRTNSECLNSRSRLGSRICKQSNAWMSLSTYANVLFPRHSCHTR